MMLVLVLSIVLALSVLHIQASTDCAVMGFNAELLQCSTCDSFRGLSLEEECNACCHTPVEEKYELVVLEVDKRWLSWYESVATLVKMAKQKTPNEFSDIVVRYQFGARPQLHLYIEKDDEFAADSVSISSWSLDVISDFVASNTKVHEEKEG
jgi:hypothetical protein